MKESILAWLLHLWDSGAEGMMQNGTELSKVASVTADPALHQQLYTSVTDETVRSLLACTLFTTHKIWPNPGDVPMPRGTWAPMVWKNYRAICGKWE